MILAVDVGNSRVRLGLVGDRGVGPLARVPTDSPSLEEDFRGALERLVRGRAGIPVGLASVVPPVTERLRALLQADGREVMEVTPESVAGMRIGYADPGEVGADRLANAVAATRHFGAPVIVVDVGTAVTLELVDGVGTFWGGPIFPGPGLARKALGEHAARLRGHLRHQGMHGLLGDSTAACLAAGIGQGYPALIEGLVGRAREEIGYEAPAVLTGGGAPALGGTCRGITAWDPLLTLRGVAAFAEPALP
ncbi:type III pantothenate kinase [Thiohalorhabdus denitrificans]|uniref:Type III pantothenate kinase n=1 Tax=Thiohalorhabdus denitrificans TaxID=381306 RepID=A0A1G5HYD4_9GAMM|nr:type III pantothenate kinase [Thiohalorhabdus denitrificans]